MAKKNITVLSVRDLRIRKSAAFIKIDDSAIDYSDIPEFTEDQLRRFKRRGRPVIGTSPRMAISIRIDSDVLKKLKKKAKTLKIGYQSLINEILKKAV